MKKLSVLIILAALVFSGNAQAVQKTMKAKDSAWLADENVMTSDIGQAISNVVPLGSIVAYPNVKGISSLLANDWIECNGSSIPSDKDIVKKMGITRTPNLYAGKGSSGQGYFLRAGKDPGYMSADLMRSHNHEQPSHVHEVDTNLTSTAVSGTADGQMYNNTQLYSRQGSRSYMNMHGDSSDGYLNYTYYGERPAGDGSANLILNSQELASANFYQGSTTTDGSHWGHGDWESGFWSAGAHSHTVTGVRPQTGYAFGLYEWQKELQAKSSVVNANVDNRHAAGEAHDAGDDPT